MLDVQCGFERLQTLLVAAQTGINYIKTLEKRSLDDHKKAEGLMSGSVSLPGKDVKVED